MARSITALSARLKWSVSPHFDDADHEPGASVTGALTIAAKPGTAVRLRGQVSDPDGDEVVVNWCQFHDAGTYSGDIALADASTLTPSFEVPTDAQSGQTIHIILEATDCGVPPLTRYKRVVVSVR